MKKPIERSRLLRSLFFPHPAVVAVCVPAAAALVSMLSLEVAMLAAFSTEEQAAFSARIFSTFKMGRKKIFRQRPTVCTDLREKSALFRSVVIVTSSLRQYVCMV